MTADELLETIRRELSAPVRIPDARIAEVYQITRQRLSHLKANLSLSDEVIQNPCALLEILLASGNRSPFRTRLLDVDFRLQAGLRIDEIFFELVEARNARILKRYAKQLSDLSLPKLGIGSFASAIAPSPKSPN